jgi:hypothetical protein
MLVRIGSGVARFGLPGVLVGVMLAWICGGRGPEVLAQSGSGSSDASSTAARPAPRPSDPKKAQPTRPVTTGETGGTLALIASPPGQAQWLYLIDTKKQAFAVYRIDPGNMKGSVKLEASRQYKWDLELEHYNNQAPEPDAIKASVKSLDRSTP